MLVGPDPLLRLSVRAGGSPPLNILTFDLEDWYPSEYYQPSQQNDEPTKRHLEEVLRLLRETGNAATFFILGELAERQPQLLDAISSQEHEVAYHSFQHQPLPRTSPQAFSNRLDAFIKLARERTGERPIGFRAPLFSLDATQSWILKVLEERGFKYDSSIFPARSLLYGTPHAPLTPYHPSYADPGTVGSARLWEFPLNTLPLGPLRIPAAGGFYLRLLPTRLLEYSLRKNSEQSRPSILYLHPRELDSKLTQVPLTTRQHFMLYFNLQKVRPTLRKLLREFKFEPARNLVLSLP